jgi:hypothetical protein
MRVLLKRNRVTAMKMRKQKGITLIGFGIVLVLAVFFAYVGMRLVPLYLEYHAVVGAMDRLQEDPGAARLPPAKIRERIMRSLYVSYASKNVQRHHIKIKRSNGVLVTVAYEVRRPMLGNVDVVVSFDRSVTLRQ